MPPSGDRGPSGLLNEPAILRLVEATRERVLGARRREAVPLLVGGDCPVVLGAMAALRDAGDAPGLLMLDGHEDAWPPHRSETGEGSDSEIAIALGTVPGLPAALERLVPLLIGNRLAYLGPRDRDEILAAGVESLRNRVAFFADDGQVSAALRAGRDPATEATGALAASSFWLHVDLDVSPHRPSRPSTIRSRGASTGTSSIGWQLGLPAALGAAASASSSTTRTSIPIGTRR
jgi:arginase